MGCVQSIFGGRHIFSDRYSGANVTTTNGSLPWYTEVESQPGFTANRAVGSSLYFDMPAASTVGGYADYISQRVRGFLGSANMEILMRVYGSTATETYTGAFFRGNNTSSKSADAGSCLMQVGSIDALYITLDVAENITSFAFAPTNNVYAYLRMAAIGRDFYLKGWSEVNPEPNHWQAIHRYTGANNPPNNFNTFGIGMGGGNSGVINFTAIAVDLDVWDLSLCHEGAMVGGL